MMVIFVSECEKGALKRTRRILDSFAERIGTNTWRTVITKEGLNAVHKLLRRTATKSTAVACHWIRSHNRSDLVWIVGNRDRFNAQGVVPVHRTSIDLLKLYEENDWKDLDVMKALTAVAALFHDWGKASRCFQEKLRERAPKADALRHEWVSVMLLGSFVSIDPDTWKERILNDHMDQDAILQKLETFNIEEFSTFPIDVQLIAWLILSHHRLPLIVDENKIGKETPLENWEEFFGSVDQAWGYRNDKENETPCFEFPHGLLLESQKWRAMLKRWVHRLQGSEDRILISEESGTLRYTAHYSRLALMLGDHNYSSKDANPTWPETVELFANTDRKTKTFKQRLDEHLCGVCETALSILYRLPLLREELPRSQKIAALRKPSPPPFAWQDKAVRKIAEFYDPKERKRGFFAVNMASTGMGKTVANAKIMRALSKDAQSLRYVLALGLRTLTLQTGDEYRSRLGLENEDMAVIIGSKATIRLHAQAAKESENAPLDPEAAGSESLETLVDEAVVYDVPADESYLSSVLRGEKERKILYAPVLVATIDHLMGAVDTPKGGRWLLPALRLMSSDIVIDEIDDFVESDLIAIGRLVFLAGMSGRKVMISSATIPPDLAEGFFHAYSMGWRIFAESHDGADGMIDAFWCDEFKSDHRSVSSDERAQEDYRNAHRRFIDARVKKLQALPPKRRGIITDLQPDEPNTPERYFEQIVEQMVRLHNRHHLVDPKTGKRVSIGVVRMANITPCVELGRYLSVIPLERFDLRFTVYHSQQVLLMRHDQERYLDRLLKRKKKMKIFDDPIIRRHIETSEKNDLLFVVVATPVEEVGRDHDFDWAVVEPSSYRSIIQLAGRVRRHREGEVQEANVAILRYNYRAFIDGDRSGRRFFLHPGFEVDTTLTTHDMKRLVDEEALRKGIDAIPRIRKNDPLQPTKRLADLEHFAVAQWLTQYDKPYAGNLEGYLRGAWYLTAMPMHYHPFRKSSPTVKCYRVYDEDEDRIYFAELDEEGNPIDREKALGIRMLETESDERFWLERDYKNLIERYTERMNMPPKRLTLQFGEISWKIYKKSDIGNMEYRYHDQFGLFTLTKEVNL